MKKLLAILCLCASTVPAYGQYFYSGRTSGGGGGGGTVTSVVIAGTANQIGTSGTCTITSTGTCTLSLLAAQILGTDNSVAGTVQLANGSAAAHTILGSGATTSNTLLGPATVIGNNHMVGCSTAGTVCTFIDLGAVPAAGVSSFTGDGTILSNSASTGAVTATQATSAAFTLLANNSNGSSAVGAVTFNSLFGSCSGATNALTYNTTTHVFGCNTISGGVTSVFTRTGAVVAASGDYTADLITSPAASFTWTLPATNLMTLAGTAPASSGSSGTNAGAQLSVTGTAGGATTITTAGTGGTGSSPSIVAGAGGAATGIGGNTTVGGAGGGVTITAGAGGAGSAGNNSGGAGGGITLTSGAGGAKTGTGTAGAAGVINLNGLTVNTSGNIVSTTSNSLSIIPGTSQSISLNALNTLVMRGVSGSCISTSANCSPTAATMALDMQGPSRHGGHVFYHSTAPTIAGTGCTAVSGSMDQRGGITLSAGATACTVTFGSAFLNPIPMVSSSSALITPVVSTTTAVLTITVAAASGTVYYSVDDLD